MQDADLGSLREPWPRCDRRVPGKACQRLVADHFLCGEVDYWLKSDGKRTVGPQLGKAAAQLREPGVLRFCGLGLGLGVQ